MFILTKIADLVQIAPRDFKKRSLAAIEDNINRKYSNKVIQHIGLCVCLYDLLWASEGLIGHGDGFVNVNVEFRIVVFRPFRGEVLLGEVSSCKPEGIFVRTKFFFDIFVPFDELPDGAEYDVNKQLWCYVYDEDDRDSKVYYELYEPAKFKIIDEEWHDQTPTKPIDRRGAFDQSEEALPPPYRIRASMREGGLGMCEWFDQ